MNVEVLRSTDQPERLVCQAARGDYYDGYVGDVEYAELMSNVKFDDSDVGSGLSEVEAKTKAFTEKQLSRGHYGPWEHPQITFAVEGVSRVTMAQITRHRLMSFDVQSMRYVDFSEADIVTPKSLIDPDHFSRETGEVAFSDERERERLLSQYEEFVEDAVEMYDAMTHVGVPKEDARFALPLGTPVNMTFSGNARTFMHLLDMRKKANAQWEIRELCNRLIEELMEWMPYSYGYYDRNAPHKLAP